jgi:hypothetical protein
METPTLGSFRITSLARDGFHARPLRCGVKINSSSAVIAVIAISAAALLEP